MSIQQFHTYYCRENFYQIMNLRTHDGPCKRFLIGDKVVGLGSTEGIYMVTTTGYEGVVTKVFGNSGYIELDNIFNVESKHFKLVVFKLVVEDEPSDKRYLNDFIKITERTPFDTTITVGIQTNALSEQKDKKTMNVADKIKNFLLSKEDRILRENNLEDDNGNPTTYAIDMMDDELSIERWGNRREEIAKNLLDIEKSKK